MREAGPELVTLHLWRVPRLAVPAAVLPMAVDGEFEKAMLQLHTPEGKDGSR